jgi:hypothetical protein
MNTYKFLLGIIIVILAVTAPLLSLTITISLILIHFCFKDKIMSGNDLLMLARSENPMDNKLFENIVLSYAEELITRQFITPPHTFDYEDAYKIVLVHLNRFPDCRKYDIREIIFEALSKKYPSNYILV